MNATTAFAPPAGYELTEWPGRGPIYAFTEPTVTLGDGLTGYWMTPGGACLRAAVATVLQRPLETIPADLTDASSLLIWSDQAGLDFGIQRAGVGPRPMGLSIGVTFAGNSGSPDRHTVVLRDGVLFFDPAQRFLWPPKVRDDGSNRPAAPPAPVTANQIEEVITLRPKEMH